MKSAVNDAGGAALGGLAYIVSDLSLSVLGMLIFTL